MKSESVISERGQVTLPKKLREHLGLAPGVKVTFVPSPQGILIRKSGSRAASLREVFGIIKDRVGTDAYLRRTRGKVE
ncbi:MAG TPA: AbrB family transcriptional regulator [Deltaproteobacteria bacterium]|nr:AbrB family transcriptional regulator [Deltaproteobacteria bacterium]